MLALEGMKNAQRNRSMYLRVGERLAEIRKSRKISQSKLANLLGVVEGTIQKYDHGRNEPNITRLYDALPKPRISACSTFNSPKPTAVRSSCRCSSVNCLSSLSKSALKLAAGCVDRGLAPTLVIVKP